MQVTEQLKSGAEQAATAVEDGTRQLTDEQMVPGLESLPISFYRDTARAYLERAEKS